VSFLFLNSWKTINAFTITISIEWKNKTFHYTTYKLVKDLFKKQVYLIGAVGSNSSTMPTV
jgi:hypothetical protein